MNRKVNLWELIPHKQSRFVLFLIGFILLAGAFAGGGVIMVLGAVVLLGVSCVFFLKCKPWENQKE